MQSQCCAKTLPRVVEWNAVSNQQFPNYLELRSKIIYFYCECNLHKTTWVFLNNFDFCICFFLLAFHCEYNLHRQHENQRSKEDLFLNNFDVCIWLFLIALISSVGFQICSRINRLPNGAKKKLLSHYLRKMQGVVFHWANCKSNLENTLRGSLKGLIYPSAWLEPDKWDILISENMHQWSCIVLCANIARRHVWLLCPPW